MLLDLDGTLYTDAGALPGAVDVVKLVRRRGVPFRFVSNTSGRSRSRVVQRLRAYGLDASPEELITSVVAAARILGKMGAQRIAPFLKQAALEDLADFELVGGVAPAAAGKPDAVVVGDMGDQWSHALMNQAFRYLLDGAPLVVAEKDRYWLGPTGLELDAGPYVVALEYAAGVQATVCGKPSHAFYDTAMESMGWRDWRRNPNAIPVMIGDDVWSDVDGAQKAGLEGWLVRTGKYRPDVLERSGVQPNRVLNSIADLCV